MCIWSTYGSVHRCVNCMYKSTRVNMYVSVCVYTSIKIIQKEMDVCSLRHAHTSGMCTSMCGYTCLYARSWREPWVSPDGAGWTGRLRG